MNTQHTPLTKIPRYDPGPVLHAELKQVIAEGFTIFSGYHGAPEASARRALGHAWLQCCIQDQITAKELKEALYRAFRQEKYFPVFAMIREYAVAARRDADRAWRASLPALPELVTQPMTAEQERAVDERWKKLRVKYQEWLKRACGSEPRPDPTPQQVADHNRCAAEQVARLKAHIDQ